VIWNWIIDTVFEILYYLIGVLPDINSTINNNINNFLAEYKSIVAPLNYIFPVDTFFTVFGFILAIESIIFSYKFVLWISAHISAGFVKH
jgi:hypothetical protein